MSNKTIPNLAPAVFVSPSAQIEICQDGVSMRASAGQLAKLAGIGGPVALVKDTATGVVTFPVFAHDQDGLNSELYTSYPNLTYIPLEGRLSSLHMESTQGIALNNSSTTLDYTIPAGDNAISGGPIVVSSVITVLDGSEWAVV
jgi:hypothetical protein